VSIRNVKPDQVVDALIAANWNVVGERPGAYKRLALPGPSQHRHKLVIPLDESAPEFADMMGAALGQLEQLMFDGRDAHRALHRLDPDVYR
jgi:hypothetical protein